MTGRLTKEDILDRILFYNIPVIEPLKEYPCSNLSVNGSCYSDSHVSIRNAAC